MSSDVDKLLNDIKRCMEELKEHVDGVLEAFYEVKNDAESVKDEAAERVEEAERDKQLIGEAFVDLFMAIYGDDYMACRNDSRLTIDQSDNVIIEVMRMLEDGE